MIPGSVDILHFSPKGPHQLEGPPSFQFNWYPLIFPGLKRPLREADHLRPSRAYVKNEWS